MTSLPSSISAPPRGNLKVYLGFAPGVGKTFQMLTDAQDAVRRGADLAVGYFETHKREDTLALIEGLEVIPRRTIAYRDRAFEEMDVAAILQRNPQTCLVDELAHTNVPGVERAKRWEDVAVLLDAGIHVWTTLNVQHIESLNDAVFEITGVRVRETVPDWIMKQATEIQLVDATPEALLNRLRRGAVYTGDMAHKAVDSFFRESNLRTLRELAMREAAHEVQVRHLDFAARKTDQDGTAASPDHRKERILLLVIADATTGMLIRRGRRVADYLSGDCLAVYIHPQEHFNDVPAEEREEIERHLNFARNLRIETRILQGRETAHTLLEFARRNEVTQIFLSRIMLDCGFSFFHPNVARQIIRLGHDMQITVVSSRRNTESDAGSTQKPPDT